MTVCPVCDFDAARLELVSLPAARFGFPSGTLHGVERVVCDDCGEATVSVPAVGAVERAYRAALAQIDRPLTGPEFAFLRRTLGVTGQGYAEALGVSNVTVSRVENSAQVTTLQDVLVRALTMLDTSQPGAIAQLTNRQGNDVSVDATRIALGRHHASGQWLAAPTSPVLTNVVALRRRETPRGSLLSTEFTAAQEPQFACR